MKLWFFSAFIMLFASGFPQNLQLHYDLRHSIDPELNPSNYTAVTFEYFKNMDTVVSGSFLFKFQADLNGKNNNVGQVFTQASQSIKFWKPGIYLSFNYSGGLGFTKDSYGYYLTNSFGLGISYPFQCQGAWFAASLLFRYNAFDKPSYDPQLTFYFGKGFFAYRIFAAGSFVFWTENRDRGIESTKDKTGKKFAFFGDPQIWFRILKGLSAGSRINVFYHLLTEDDKIQLYPTLGLKYQF